MDLIVIAVRDSPVQPWRPTLVHSTGVNPAPDWKDVVVQALVDGKAQYGDANCACVTVTVPEHEITAVSRLSVTPPEASAPETPDVPVGSTEQPGEVPTTVEETPAPEADPASSSSSEDPGTSADGSVVESPEAP